MSSANKNHQQRIEIEELAKGISSIEDYFNEVKKAQDKQRPLLLKHADWVSFCLSVLGSILLVSSRPILIFMGLLLLLVGLGLFLLMVFVEGREAAQTFSNIPLSHLKTMKLEVPPTIKLYKNLAKLEVDALELLHISLTSQKEYTHNVNKLMLGDLGFLPTIFLGVSGALTLKGLLALDTTYLSMIIAFVVALSFVSFYIRSSVGRYQEVTEILLNVISSKQNLPDS